MAGSVQDSNDDLDDLDETSEINITPFIDVMLVLLIIFMVAAPLSTVDVHVNLPVATAKPQPRPDKPVFITLKADKTLSVGEAPIERKALISRLDDATKSNRDARLFLRADASVNYGEVLGVLDLLRAAGYLKVGLVALEGGAARAPSTEGAAAR
ncbi:MAG: TonB system transport protein ExbD [Hyphomicrobiaceae bacterium]